MPKEVLTPEVVDIDDLPSIADAALPAVIEVGTEVEVRSLVAQDEWADIDDGDLSPDDAFKIPLYQLNRKAGEGFYNEDTGATEQEILAVLMAKVNTRAWWPQQFGSGDAAPACRSDNGSTANVDRSPALADDWEAPTKNLRRTPVEKPTGDCSTCPNALWDGDDPAPCSTSIEFLAFVPTEIGAGRFVRLRFSGMGYGPARDYWQSFKTRLPKRPPLSVVTRISLETKETPNGDFLVPKFTRAEELAIETARPIIDSTKSVTAEWREQVASDDRPHVTPDATVEAHDEEPF